MTKMLYKKVVERFDFLKLESPFSSRIKLVALSFLFPLKRRLGLGPTIDAKVVLAKWGREATFYIHTLVDLAVIREVFINNEYKILGNNNPKVIFDVGGNVGVATIYFKLQFPDAQVYTFEPDPFNFTQLEKNIAELKGVKCFNVFVQHIESPTEIYVEEGSGISSSSVKRFETQKKISVKGTTLDTIAKQEGVTHIDVLKFDIEGGEATVFDDQDIISNTQFLLGEFHEDLTHMKVSDFTQKFPYHTSSIEQVQKERFIVKLTRE